MRTYPQYLAGMIKEDLALIQDHKGCMNYIDSFLKHSDACLSQWNKIIRLYSPENLYVNALLPNAAEVVRALLSVMDRALAFLPSRMEYQEQYIAYEKRFMAYLKNQQVLFKKLNGVPSEELAKKYCSNHLKNCNILMGELQQFYEKALRMNSECAAIDNVLSIAKPS